ncbi:MAG: hypothetical protein GWP09_02620, partial [Nitrospiraceae bacterium]|nr:hypothetical protein [Nitrospiraceae bacterium]
MSINKKVNMKSSNYQLKRRIVIISLSILTLALIILLIFNIKSFILINNKMTSNSSIPDLSIQNKLYDSGNKLIDINSKLPLLQFERKLPLELTLSDMYVLVHDDSNFTNFKLFSMNYIINLYNE